MDPCSSGPGCFAATHFPNHLLRNQETPVTNLFPKCNEGPSRQEARKLFPFTGSRNKPPLHNFWVPRCSNTVDPSPRRHVFPECPWDSLQQAEASTRGVPVQPPWTEAWVSPACLPRLPEAPVEEGTAPSLLRVLSINMALVERARPGPRQRS